MTSNLLKKVSKNEKGLTSTTPGIERKDLKSVTSGGKLETNSIYHTFKLVDSSSEMEDDFEDNEALASQLFPELQRLRIQNQYLFEQNRAVSRELGQAKLTAQALRQIISQKDEELIRVRSENRKALIKVCSLEGMLYKSTARQRSSLPQPIDANGAEFEDDEEEPLTPPSNKGRIHNVSLVENKGAFASAEYDGFSVTRAKSPFDFMKATSAILRNNRA